VLSSKFRLLQCLEFPGWLECLIYLNFSDYSGPFNVTLLQCPWQSVTLKPLSLETLVGISRVLWDIDIPPACFVCDTVLGELRNNVHEVDLKVLTSTINQKGRLGCRNDPIISVQVLSSQQVITWFRYALLLPALVQYSTVVSGRQWLSGGGDKMNPWKSSLNKSRTTRHTTIDRAKL
jgi:hypothetical protein